MKEIEINTLFPAI